MATDSTAELEFRVMGTDAHVIVVGSDARHARRAALVARDRLHELEARWSRFLPDSEVSRLNAASGVPVVVSSDTLGLVERAVEGWRRTHGSFDPTVLDALVAQGYDRDFGAIDHTTYARTSSSTGSWARCACHAASTSTPVASARGSRPTSSRPR